MENLNKVIEAMKLNNRLTPEMIEQMSPQQRVEMQIQLAETIANLKKARAKIEHVKEERKANQTPKN